MDFSKTSDWLQVTANLGIVAGLLLVGVQLQQNTDLLKTQMLYEESRRIVDLGLLEDEEWRFRVRNDTSFFFGNRYGTAWWKEFSDEGSTLPQDLIDAVNARLSETSPDSTLDYFAGKFEYLDLTPADGDTTPD